MLDASASQRSFKGKLWGSASRASGSTESQLKNMGCSGIVARVLAARGIQASQFEDFKKPLLRNLCPKPDQLVDMERAAARIFEAVREKKTIGIWSDYDVDGGASAAAIWHFLELCGHTKMVCRIPDRLTEGYGPNTPGLVSLVHDNDCDVVMILDSGTVAFEPLKSMAEIGVDVVVLDHHMPDKKLPEVHALVNPRRTDGPSGLEHLCTGGLSLIFCLALARKMQSEGYCDGRDGRPSSIPNPMEVVDLAALATCCDMVALTGVNRAIVATGEKLLSRRTRPGIRALAHVSGIEETSFIDAKACGWLLGPRINSGGRIGDSEMGFRLLIEKDFEKAMEIARQLHDLNAQRKAMSDAAADEAKSQIGARPVDDRRPVLAVLEDAHEGIVGLAASRCMDAYQVPAIVLSVAHGTAPDGGRLLKGSGRSMVGFSIGGLAKTAQSLGITVKAGGHEGAAGFTLPESNLDAFRSLFESEVASSEFGIHGAITHIDMDLPADQLSLKLCDEVEAMAPFGMGNPQPLAILRRAYIADVTLLKGRHVKINFSDKKGRRSGIVFGVAGTPLGEGLLSSKGQFIDLLGHLEINDFMGRSAQIKIVDARPSSS